MRQRPFGILTAVALAVLFFPAISQAQFAVGAGPSFPTGDLADEAVRGFHVQGSVGFAPAVLPFGLRADLFYQTFGNVEREPGINVSLGGEWFRQLGLMLNAVYGIPLGEVLAPYALVGVGYLHEWHGDRSYSGTDHNTFNLNAGLGVDVALMNGVALFVEARQLNIAGGKELSLTPPAVQSAVAFKSIPVTIGLRF